MTENLTVTVHLKAYCLKFENLPIYLTFYFYSTILWNYLFILRIIETCSSIITTVLYHKDQPWDNCKLLALSRGKNQQLYEYVISINWKLEKERTLC